MRVAADILCVGDLDLDLFVSVPVIPGFDQKVGGRHLGQMPGGMSANSAVAFTRLGRPARLMAAIGDDAGGGEALMKVAAEGVDVGHVVRRSGVNSFMCVVLLSPSGEKSLIRLETDAYLPRVADIEPAVFDGIRHVHVTYGDAGLTEHVLRQARDRGLTASLDLEPPDILRAPERLAPVLELVDTLFVNREAWLSAAEALAHPSTPTMLKRQGGEIVVTMGADGCRHIGPAGETIRARRGNERSCDTTGAGDCFAAAYVAAKLEGAPCATACASPTRRRRWRRSPMARSPPCPGAGMSRSSQIPGKLDPEPEGQPMPERRFEHVEELKAAGLTPPDDATLRFLWQIVDEGVLGASRHVALGNELLLHILDTVPNRWEALLRARMAARFIARTRGHDTPVIGNSLTLLLAGLDDIPEGKRATELRTRIGNWARPRRPERAGWSPRPSSTCPMSGASWRSTIPAPSRRSSWRWPRPTGR